jgi:hypothetical protein
MIPLFKIASITRCFSSLYCLCSFPIIGTLITSLFCQFCDAHALSRLAPATDRTDSDELRAVIREVYTHGRVGALAQAHDELARVAGSPEMLATALAALPATSDAREAFYWFHVICTCLGTSFWAMPEAQRQQIKEALFDYPVLHEDCRVAVQQAKAQLGFMLQLDKPNYVPFWECVLAFLPAVLMEFRGTFFALKGERPDLFLIMVQFLTEHRFDVQIVRFAINAGRDLQLNALAVLNQMMGCMDLNPEIEMEIATLIDNALGQSETTPIGLEFLTTYLSWSLAWDALRWARVEAKQVGNSDPRTRAVALQMSRRKAHTGEADSNILSTFLCDKCKVIHVVSPVLMWCRPLITC